MRHINFPRLGTWLVQSELSFGAPTDPIIHGAIDVAKENEIKK